MQLAESSWGEDPTILGTATCALFHFGDEYCVLVWCFVPILVLSASPLKSIKDALRIVTGCLCPTIIDNFLILSGIQLIELCCKKAALSLSLVNPNGARALPNVDKSQLKKTCTAMLWTIQLPFPQMKKKETYTYVLFCK